MKVPGFLTLFAVAGIILVCISFSSSISRLCFPALVSTSCDDSTIITVSRKLKENRIGMRSNKKNGMGDATLNDYGPFDPTPSSKTIKPGPVQHGTPLIPFIPKPTLPPVPPRAGGYAYVPPSTGGYAYVPPSTVGYAYVPPSAGGYP